MKNLKQYINEWLIKKKVDKVKGNEYEYTPKNRKELHDIIENLLKQNKTDLNCIDTSNVETMNTLFSDLKDEGYNIDNVDISKWNVSNVQDFGTMFYNCENFNCDLSDWDLSSCKRTANMFMDCNNLNFDASNWKFDNVEYSRNMFLNCKSMNCNLNNWTISPKLSKSRATDMFQGCKKSFIPDWYKQLK